MEDSQSIHRSYNVRRASGVDFQFALIVLQNQLTTSVSLENHCGEFNGEPVKPRGDTVGIREVFVPAWIRRVTLYAVYTKGIGRARSTASARRRD